MCFCRDHLPGHSYTYKSPAKREAAAAAVDLSNATFSALEDQIEGLNEIRVTQGPCACLGLFVCMQNSKADSLAQSQYCLPLQSFVMSLVDTMLGSHSIPANAACTPLHSSQIMWSTHSVFCHHLLLMGRYST